MRFIDCSSFRDGRGAMVDLPTHWSGNNVAPPEYVVQRASRDCFLALVDDVFNLDVNATVSVWTNSVPYLRRKSFPVTPSYTRSSRVCALFTPIARREDAPDPRNENQPGPHERMVAVSAAPGHEIISQVHILENHSQERMVDRRSITARGDS